MVAQIACETPPGKLVHNLRITPTLRRDVARRVELIDAQAHVYFGKQTAVAVRVKLRIDGWAVARKAPVTV